MVTDETRPSGDKVVMLPTGGRPIAVPHPQLDVKGWQLVRRLRILLQNSFLQPREDLDQACRLIAAEPDATAERYAAAFFHGLSSHALRKIQFFPQKSNEVSIDEMWMIRLLKALQGEDEANARYLLALRVDAPGRRRLLFLAHGLAGALKSSGT